MKRITRNLQGFGTVVLTPALTGQPQAATARAIDYVEAVQVDHGGAENALTTAAVDREPQWSILDLSVPEKLLLGRRAIPSAKWQTFHTAVYRFPRTWNCSHPCCGPALQQTCITYCTAAPTERPGCPIIKRHAPPRPPSQPPHPRSRT
jgi:hypothetical protein